MMIMARNIDSEYTVVVFHYIGGLGRRILLHRLSMKEYISGQWENPLVEKDPLHSGGHCEKMLVVSERRTPLHM